MATDDIRPPHFPQRCPWIKEGALHKNRWGEIRPWTSQRRPRIKQVAWNIAQWGKISTITFWRDEPWIRVWAWSNDQWGKMQPPRFRRDFLWMSQGAWDEGQEDEIRPLWISMRRPVDKADRLMEGQWWIASPLTRLHVWLIHSAHLAVFKGNAV